MKYLILIGVIFSLPNTCVDNTQQVTLHFYVVDAATKKGVEKVQIGNYVIDDQQKKTIKVAGITDSIGHWKEMISSKPKPAMQPFVFHYLVKKKGYKMDTISFNDHGYTMRSSQEVVIDTIYLQQQE